MEPALHPLKRSLPGRRPKAQATDHGTRALVLAAARSVFARRGFDGTTTREVADLAGVNNAMIYYHFRDKEELYRSVLNDSFEALDRVWDHPVFRQDTPVRDKVACYIAEVIRFHHANDDLRRIFARELASSGERIKWIGDRYFSRHYRSLSAVLRQGIRSGELRRFDTATAAASLIGMVIHPFVLKPVAEFISGKSMDLSVERFGALVTDLFFDGLKKRAHVNGAVRKRTALKGAASHG